MSRRGIRNRPPRPPIGSSRRPYPVPAPVVEDPFGALAPPAPALRDVDPAAPLPRRDPDKDPTATLAGSLASYIRVPNPAHHDPRLGRWKKMPRIIHRVALAMAIIAMA